MGNIKLGTMSRSQHVKVVEATHEEMLCLGTAIELQQSSKHQAKVTLPDKINHFL